MSLRSFHLFFIALSVMLAAFFTAWSAEQYRLEHDLVYAVAGILGIATAGALATYGIAFQKKTRGM